MFEAKLAQSALLKKVLEAVKEVVAEGNWDCSSTGISLQGMDSSHVSLVALEMNADGFDPFRCDRNLTLGINMSKLNKIVRCSNNDDSVTIRASDSSDHVTLLFESPNQDRVSEYEMKLMDIDSEHVGIPDEDHDVIVTMPSSELQRICRDLSNFGDSVNIACTKDGVSFSASGDLGSGRITLRQNYSVDKEEEQVTVEMVEPCSLTFALRYLNFFTKATPLSPLVRLSLKTDQPLVVEYRIEEFGHIRYYLAPKVEEDENTANQPNTDEM